MILKLALLQIPVAFAALTGTVVYRMGMVRIEVQSKSPGGEHLRLMAPGALLPVGAMLLPTNKTREASRQLQPWLPAIRAATEELMRCPDATLVQIDGRQEHVRIAKVRDALMVDVDDAGETVHVSVPLRAAAYACNRLAGKVPAQPATIRHQPI